MQIDNKKYSLEKATVLLFHPIAHTRSMLRSVVMGLGFTQVNDFSELRPARNSIVDRGADLIFLDIDDDNRAICKLVREIRIDNVSADPFVPIIGFSLNPDIRMVNNGMEAGVDDLVSLPISHKIINDRVAALIENRKGFVVTSSYVGPDRRAPSRSQEDELGLGNITVPNNLRFKVTGDRDAMASSDAVAEARASIDHHRLNRYAQRISWLIQQIREGKPDGRPVALVTAERHEEIGRMIENIAYDLRMQGHPELLEITDSMGRLLDMLQASPRPQFYDFLLLHAQATISTLMAREGAKEMVSAALRETSDYLDRIQAA